MACFSGANIVNDGLVLHIDLANKRTGTTIKTDLINGIILEELNGVSNTIDNLGEWVFDGVDDFIDLGISSALNLMTNESAIAWVCPFNIDSGRRARIGNRHGGFLTMADSRFGYEGQNNSGVWVNNTYTPNNTLKIDTWQQIAYSFGANDRVDLYHNSNYITGKETIGSINNSTLKFVIGTENNGGWGNPPYFMGKIGIVQVYDKKLTQEEIQQNFEATRSRYSI